MPGAKPLLLATGLALGLALPHPALAQGQDGTTPALPEPGQSVGDRAIAESLVKELERDAAHRAVLTDAIRQAKDALERATRMHAANDEARAKAAEGLAREWAETGRDLAKAVTAEASAAELRQKTLDAQAGLERARALVEEGIARVGRLQTELSRAGRHEKGAQEARVAVEVHEGDPVKEPKKKGPKKSADNKKAPSKEPAAGGGTP
jgi:hypothetical protein